MSKISIPRSISCNDTDKEWCIDQIKIKAREIGADAIILQGASTSESYGIPIGYSVFFATEEYGLKAVAIKYLNN